MAFLCLHEIANFIIHGLYDAIELDVNDLEEMKKYLSQSEYSGKNMDCYCVCCGTNRIFEFSNSVIKKIPA